MGNKDRNILGAYFCKYMFILRFVIQTTVNKSTEAQHPLSLVMNVTHRNCIELTLKMAFSLTVLLL